MLNWLHALLPHLSRQGYVLVFLVVLLNNLGVPLPGETFLLASGFIFGKTATSLWLPILAGTAACFIGGIGAFWLGRQFGLGSLEKIHLLHLTPKKVAWPERFFKRHGEKTVIIARFIPFFPPVAVNFLAGSAKIPWRPFLFYNLAGSAAHTTSFIFIGYFFGKRWKQLEAWLGPTALYLIIAGIILIILGVAIRHYLAGSFVRLRAKKHGHK